MLLCLTNLEVLLTSAAQGAYSARIVTQRHFLAQSPLVPLLPNQHIFENFQIFPCVTNYPNHTSTPKTSATFFISYCLSLCHVDKGILSKPWSNFNDRVPNHQSKSLFAKMPLLSAPESGHPHWSCHRIGLHGELQGKCLFWPQLVIESHESTLMFRFLAFNSYFHGSFNQAILCIHSLECWFSLPSLFYFGQRKSPSPITLCTQIFGDREANISEVFKTELQAVT
jgi:hypothetical protein